MWSQALSPQVIQKASALNVITTLKNHYLLSSPRYWRWGERRSSRGREHQPEQQQEHQWQRHENINLNIHIHNNNITVYPSSLTPLTPRPPTPFIFLLFEALVRPKISRQTEIFSLCPFVVLLLHHIRKQMLAVGYLKQWVTQVRVYYCGSLATELTRDQVWTVGGGTAFMRIMRGATTETVRQCSQRYNI